MTTESLEKEIQRELTRMDHGLWLDKEWGDGYLYYVVKAEVPGAAPLTVVDWRVGDFALPLSMDLLVRVRNQEGDILDALKDVKLNNAVRMHNERQAALQEAEDRAHEWQYEKRGKKQIYHGK